VHRACRQVAWAEWAEWITKVPQHRMTGGQNPAPLLRKVGAGLSSQPKKRLVGSNFTMWPSSARSSTKSRTRVHRSVSHSIKGASVRGANVRWIVESIPQGVVVARPVPHQCTNALNRCRSSPLRRAAFLRAR
jgi:hypothetical protein